MLSVFDHRPTLPDIGGRSTAVREFGDYIYRIRCSLQEDSIVYDDLVLPISEVETAGS